MGSPSVFKTLLRAFHEKKMTSSYPLSNTRPKIWVAALLAILAPPSALLYVGRSRAALCYLGIGLGMVLCFILYNPNDATKAFLGFFYGLLCGTHAYRIAINYPDNLPRPISSRWYAITAFILLIVGLIFGTRAFGFEIFHIKSNSMSPSLTPGDQVVVKKWGYIAGTRWATDRIGIPLHHGDLIAFEFPLDRRLTYLQRVIGLPGDMIEYKNKALSINGVLIPTTRIETSLAASDFDDTQKVEVYEEALGGHRFQTVRYAHMPPMNTLTPMFPHIENCQYNYAGFKCKVPAKHYFALGDNRDDSLDSRYWGFIPEDHVLGIIIKIVH